MDIVVWTDDENVDAREIAQNLPNYWARSVRVYLRPTGEELSSYFDDEE